MSDLKSIENVIEDANIPDTFITQPYFFHVFLRLVLLPYSTFHSFSFRKYNSSRS